MKRRRRYQKGSLQLRKHAGRKVWTVLYYKPDGTRGYHTLGVASEMTKGEAQEAAEQFLRKEVNGSDRKAGATRPPTVKEFLEETYLPFYRHQWKASTKLTTERRIRQHIAGDLGKLAIESRRRIFEKRGQSTEIRSSIGLSNGVRRENAHRRPDAGAP